MKRPFLPSSLLIKSFFLILIAFWQLSAGIQQTNAQPTFQSADLITATDSMLYSQASAFDLLLNNFSTNGANVNWDYSSMTPVSQEWKHFLDPGNTGYQASYIAGCLIDCISSGGNPFLCPFSCANAWNDLDLAIPTLDTIELGILALTNVLEFMNNTGTNGGLQQEAIGYSVEVGGFPIPLINSLNSPDVIFDFPIQYGKIDSSESGYDIDLTAVGIPLAFLHRQKRINEVEGWGTLQTPYGTFNNVLKIKSTIHNMDTLIWQGDTLTLTTFLPPALAPDTEVEYKWLDPTYGYPVLEASGFELLGITTITNVDFMDSVRCFDPTALFAYLPIPTYIDSASGQVDVSFFNLSINADTYSWDFDDGGSSNSQNPIHTYTNDGFYFVTLTVCNNLCMPPVCDSITLPVIVIDTNAVVANFLAVPFSACIGQDINFVNVSIRDSVWFWDFGDGATSTLENPTHTYTMPGTYNVMLIASNAADSDTAFQTVQIGGPISGSFSWSNNLTNIPVTFSNTSMGTDSNTTFLWTFLGAGASPATSTSENPTVTFGFASPVVVCMTAINGLGCSDVVCETFNIQECLDADFSTNILINVCPGQTVVLNNTTSGLSPISYTWEVDGNYYSNATDTSVAFSSGGNHTVTLIADNGICADTITENLSVINNVTAGLDQTICQGSSVNLSANGGGALAIYNWSPSNGLSCTLCSSPTADPNNSQTYTVTTLHPLCGLLSDDVTVNVIQPVSAAFSQNIFAGTTSVVYASGSQNANSLLWDFGDGNTDTTSNPTHTYSIPGTFTVCLTASNSCGTDSVCQTVVTDCPLPVAGFVLQDSQLVVNLSDTSFNFITSWLWDFGDGNSDTTQNPTHSYAAPGTYTVCLFVSGICGGDMVCEQIAVSCPPPDANFGFMDTSLSVSFTDSTFGNPFTWAWSFGDGSGSIMPSPSHVYATPGTYTVCLTVVSVCGTDSSCQNVWVNFPTGIADEWDPFDLSLFPNPAEDKVFLSWTQERPGQVKISLRDLLGQETGIESRYTAGTGSQQFSMPLDVPAGMYLFQIEIDGQAVIRKLLIE